MGTTHQSADPSFTPFTISRFESGDQIGEEATVRSAAMRFGAPPLAGTRKI
jgi:hypothetical protein